MLVCLLLYFITVFRYLHAFTLVMVFEFGFIETLVHITLLAFHLICCCSLPAALHAVQSSGILVTPVLLRVFCHTAGRSCTDGGKM